MIIKNGVEKFPDNAERLVVHAEKKLERHKKSCASQVAILQVYLFISALLLFPNSFSSSQAKNTILLDSERAAYQCVRNNDEMMRKV